MDSEYIGQKMLEMELLGRHKSRRPPIYGCSERGHGGGWSYSTGGKGVGRDGDR